MSSHTSCIVTLLIIFRRFIENFIRDRDYSMLKSKPSHHGEDFNLITGYKKSATLSRSACAQQQLFYVEVETKPPW